MRVVFLGTPGFAVPALEIIASSAIEISAVFTQPDRPAGRGRKLTPPSIKKRALEIGLPVHQPECIRSSDILSFSPDVVVVVAYGQILSKKFLAVPRLGVVNLHASLLPRWRGAAPIQWAVLSGDETCGVCVMRVVQKLDAGPVMASSAVPIGPRDTSEDLHGKLASAGGPLMVETLQALERGEVSETPQDESLVTYAAKLSKGEAPLDWSLPAIELDRRIRGLRPWPVAQTGFPGMGREPARIWCAFPMDAEADRSALPGEVLGEGECPEGKGLRVRTGSGDLILLELQPPGRRRMATEDFLRGYSLPGGARLGNPE